MPTEPYPPPRSAAPCGYAAVVLLACLTTASPTVANPVTLLRHEGEALSSQIYDAARWTARVPYQLALPYLVRLKLDPYIARLPLEPAVRDRVLAHVHADDFVGEMIPFLQTVRDTYTAPPDDVARRFDHWLRSRFTPAARIPGFTHSLFTWTPPAQPNKSGLSLDDRLAGQLVTLYDALYLRDTPSRGLENQLTCDLPLTETRLTTLLERAQPIVRQLLDDTAAKLDPAGEFAPSLRRIAGDAERLETVTVTLIDVIRTQVCKHYRIFATRIFRESQLRAWMRHELEAPHGGALWTWLTYASSERHYAVHVVVDGLQGHLIAALADGNPQQPFLQRIREEMHDGPALRPMHEATRAAPAQATQFLERLTTKGFHHDAYLPFFRHLFTEPRGIARGGISTTPTISVRNIPIAETGAAVAGKGGTGLPNFHFVDRTHRGADGPQGRAYYFYGNDAVLLDGIARGHGMRTLFDRLPWLSSFNCAAPYDGGAHATIDSFLNLGVGENVRDFGEVLCLPALERRAATEHELQALRQKLLDLRASLSEDLPLLAVGRQLDRRAAHQLAERLIDQIAGKEQETLPEYLLYYNPWPDHFAHFKGPFSDEIIAPSGELNRLDYWLGRLSAVYASAGVADRTLFGMAGDHGLTPVFHMLNPEVAVFDALRAHGVPIRLAKISSDEGEGPKLTNRLRPPSMRNLDVVVASTAGGNYMLDFFADHGADWTRQPVYDDLTHLRLLDNPTPLDMIATLAGSLRDTLDYLAVRETPCGPPGGTVRLVGHRDGARADAWIERRGDRIFYRTQGADLLGLADLSVYDTLTATDRREHATLLAQCVAAATAAELASWCTAAQWQQLAGYTNRPDAVGQLAHLYDLDTPGTVNLFPRAGVGYNTIVPGRHAGEHFHEKDAFVGLWGTPVVTWLPSRRPDTAVNGSVPMALYDFLTGRHAVAGRDGWGYPSMIPARDTLPEPNNTNTAQPHAR